MEWSTTVEKERLEKINLWDVETGQLITTLSGLGSPPFSFSADGKLLASASAEESIRYNTDDGVSIQGQYTRRGGKVITLWDVATSQIITIFPHQRSRINELIFSPNGRRLAARSSGKVTLWDVSEWTGGPTTTPTEESDLADLFDLFDQSGKLAAQPDRTQLLQNAPNPFNSQTVLSYFLLEPGPVRLEVFSLTGQRVTVLHQGPQQAGYHRLHWDGRDAAGHSVASGAYLYRLVTDDAVLTRKLILLR